MALAWVSASRATVMWAVFAAHSSHHDLSCTIVPSRDGRLKYSATRNRLLLSEIMVTTMQKQLSHSTAWRGEHWHVYSLQDFRELCVHYYLSSLLLWLGGFIPLYRLWKFKELHYANTASRWQNSIFLSENCVDQIGMIPPFRSVVSLCSWIPEPRQYWRIIQPGLLTMT